MKPTFFALLLLSISLAGCGLQNVTRDFKLDPEGKTGLAIFSISRSGAEDVIVAAFFRGMDNSYRSYVTLPDKTGVYDWVEPCTFLRTKIFRDDTCYFRLYIIEIEEGTYEFYTISGEEGSYYLKFSPERSIAFQVKKGRAVYAGNIHFGFKIYVEKRKYFLQFESHDREKRDMDLFHERYKNVDADMIDKSINFLKK